MATDCLLIQRTADEVLEAKLEAEELVRRMDAALADGTITVDEMTDLMHQTRVFMREMAEANWWADYTYSLESAFDSARRGAALTPSDHKRRKFRAAGLDLVGVELPATTNPAARDDRVSL